MNDRGVSINYNGDEIVNLSGDGSLKLLTKNKYMEDDLEIDITRDMTIISKNVTENGVYEASDDDADGYDTVTVNVPNTYAASDEGKVVSNGALVAQTSTTKTTNGTYDTTLNNEVVVNVSGGGGGIEPLEYIEVDGTKVFNLGMQLTDISKIVLDFSINSVSRRNNFMGAQAGLIGNNTSGKVHMTNSSNTSASNVSITADRHTFVWKRLEQGQYSFKVDDGTETNINISQSSYSKDLYLMGASTSDSYKVIGRFYSAEVYDTNDVLVMSLVCKKYKNIIIIYDEISDTAIVSFVQST